jgi:hypothetical protein
MLRQLALLALSLALSLGASIALTGCGVLFGNVKPLAERSEDYQILDLSKNSQDWEKIPSSDPASGVDPEEPQSTGASDVSFQARKDPSIISLNSSCRERVRSSSKDLKGFTRELLLGITDVASRTERELALQSQPALETTVQGRMASGPGQPEPVKIRVVVLRKDECVYDLMYISRPELFAAHEPDFSRFIESLRLR